MKYTSGVLVAAMAASAVGFSGAFTQMAFTTKSRNSARFAAKIITGFEGKAASSKEEDLLLTLQIIMDHEARSSTASKEQFISQIEEAAEAADESIDVSIPYDAAAKLAYEASDKSMAYADFKTKFEADAVADVISKQPVDVSIPYDAAAKLAYGASDKSMAYAHFKTKFEADAVADVISKQPVDVSIPYDAAAKLAFLASDRSMAYPAFKVKYEADAVADVIAKKS